MCHVGETSQFLEFVLLYFQTFNGILSVFQFNLFPFFFIKKMRQVSVWFIITGEEKHKTAAMWRYEKRYKHSVSKFNQDFIKYSKVIIFHVIHTIQTKNFRWQSIKLCLLVISIISYYNNYYYYLNKKSVSLRNQFFTSMSTLNTLLFRGVHFCVCRWTFFGSNLCE